MQYNLALRSRAVRLAVPAIRPHIHARTFATVGPRATPDPSHPTTDQTDLKGLRTNKSPDKNALYIGGGLAAIGAIWYYFAVVENAHIDKEREGLDARKAGIEGGRGGSVEDASRSAKERMQEALRSGDAKYQDIKAEAQSKVQAARDQVDQGAGRGKERFDEVKEQAAHRASETYSIADQKMDAAKSTGRGWLGWGRSQTRDAADDLKRRVDETQEAWKSRFEEAKQKAAEKGEDIKLRLGETEDEFRNRIAKAIQRR